MSLGKKLVDELGLEPGVDTLSRWMAHYVAEQIESVETSQGKNKEIVQRNCFEVILNLWQHHAHYPGGDLPFERFEAIFAAVERMDPESRTHHNRGLAQLYDQGDREKSLGESQEWVNIAQNLDAINKEIIVFCLRQAALVELDGDTKEWLEHVIGLPGSDDASIVFKLVSSDSDPEDSSSQLKKKEVDRLEKRIKNLEAFDDFRGKILELYHSELELAQDELHRFESNKSGK